MSKPIEITSINISEEKGTTKKPVNDAIIDSHGVVGDAHAGAWHRQVSLLAQENIDHFAVKAKRTFAPGDFAENITLRGLDLQHTSLLDRFRISEVELEVTQLGKACHGDGCAIYREVGQCVMPKAGIFCRVLSGGSVQVGDEVKFTPKILRARVITLSDRAARKEYEDKSGPKIGEMLKTHFINTRWRAEVEFLILPDDAEQLQSEIKNALHEKMDVLITTGGTGIGPRDITPEAVRPFLDKQVPGIMEHIRLKFGEKNPNALLSRAVCGVTGQTLIYTLPGSLRAVEEYMTEILKTLEHLMLMIRGLDTHSKNKARRSTRP